MGGLHNLPFPELTPGEIDIDTYEAVPVVKALVRSVGVVYLCLEQLAPEEVMQDECRDGALALRRFGGSPGRDIGRVAGLE